MLMTYLQYQDIHTPVFAAAISLDAQAQYLLFFNPNSHTVRKEETKHYTFLRIILHTS